MNRRAVSARFAFALLASTAIPSFAVAAEPSGATVKVTPAANAIGADGDRLLAVEAPIFSGDRIKTDRGGEAQIRFRDDTRLVVGPNSSLLIDRFVFNPDASVKAVGVSMIKGAFRFVSGNGPKQAYSIKTPTVTIGIRGTEFDVDIRGGGETTVAMYTGSARICDIGGVCVVLDGGCSVVVAPPGGGIDPLPPGQRRSQRFESYFPYVRNQGGLAPGFRINTSSCGRDGSRPISPPPPIGIGDPRASDGTPRENPPVRAQPEPPVTY